MIEFDIAGHKVGIEELKADVAAAMNKFHYNDFCFTWVTVDALLNKIEELEKK
jgi:hypothetical protein